MARTMAENTLNTVFEYDEHNLGETRTMFQHYGLLDLFERMPGLLESLRREIEQHLGSVQDSLARADAAGNLHHRWDMILRVYMALSVWQQLVMAAGHLFRGHVSEVFKDVRRAVEAAGIAYLARLEPDLGAVFLSTDRNAMRNRTTSAKLFPRDSNDPLLVRLRERFDYGSQQSHNNFSSFAARVASDTYIGDDERLHIKTKFDLCEMADHGYVVGIAVWLLRAAECTALLLARSFDLPDCVWYRRLESYRRDLDEAAHRLAPMARRYAARTPSEAA